MTMESDKSDNVEYHGELAPNEKKGIAESSRGKRAQGLESEPSKDHQSIETDDSNHSAEELGISHTSTSTPPPQSTTDTMGTDSGNSSPSICNLVLTENTQDRNHDESNAESLSERINTEEESKASWESGILDSSASSLVTLKLLVTKSMAGHIIGRGGETISELQEDSSARIKLGQTGDCFPGTSERACLVNGSLENVKKAITLLLQKFYDFQLQQAEAQLCRTNATDSSKKEKEQQQLGSDDNEAQSTDENAPVPISFVVRILIPTASCGMLIGRNGANIKKLKETSCVSSVRLTAKEPDHPSSSLTLSNESMAIAATSERILTITGTELDHCISCTFLILDGFARHPDTCRYTNNTTSYSKITSSFQGQYRTGYVPYHHRSSGNARSPSTLIPSQHQAPNVEQNIHGSLNGRSTDSRVSTHSPSTSERRENQQQQQSIYRRVNPVMNQPITTTSHMQDSQIYASSSREKQQQPMHSVKILVPDSMIGAILGKRGNTLNELQTKSRTRIRISQREDFAPGTRSRIVTISGQTPRSLETAKTLIRQYISRNANDRMVPPSEQES